MIKQWNDKPQTRENYLEIIFVIKNVTQNLQKNLFELNNTNPIKKQAEFYILSKKIWG